jgi:hypothetical protein
MRFSVYCIFLSYIASPKFCINCMHFISDNVSNDFAKCNFFPVEKSKYRYLVTGQKNEDTIKYSHCTTARQLEHMCGENAKKYVQIIN